MNGKRRQRRIILVCLYAFLFGSSDIALSGTLPERGSLLPDCSFPAPKGKHDRKDRAYLGIDSNEVFKIGQTAGDYTLLEIVGVYCPQCHSQAPVFNELFRRVENDARIKGKLKILAIAAGATAEEVEYMREVYKIPFPLLIDPKFNIHSLLGEPRTPFTMLVARSGEVLYAHSGGIEDLDHFMQSLRQLVQ